MKSDIEIAQDAELKPIKEIAESVGLTEQDIYYYGPYKAKVDINIHNQLKDKQDGKLICNHDNPYTCREGKLLLL